MAVGRNLLIQDGGFDLLLDWQHGNDGTQGYVDGVMHEVAQTRSNEPASAGDNLIWPAEASNYESWETHYARIGGAQAVQDRAYRERRDALALEYFRAGGVVFQQDFALPQHTALQCPSYIYTRDLMVREGRGGWLPAYDITSAPPWLGVGAGKTAIGTLKVASVGGYTGTVAPSFSRCCGTSERSLPSRACISRGTCRISASAPTWWPATPGLNIRARASGLCAHNWLRWRGEHQAQVAELIGCEKAGQAATDMTRSPEFASTIAEGMLLNRPQEITINLPNLAPDGSVMIENLPSDGIVEVGYWHQAHSFVRGHWRNEAESISMLLTKSGHDVDWLRCVVGLPCQQASLFGSLKHFRPEAQLAGAADRCLDCPPDIENNCLDSATRHYLR